MAEQKAVTVAEVPGATVVVNNKRDGIKKYATASALFIFGALISAAKRQWPQYEPLINAGIEVLAGLGLFGAGVALTSPFDKRGVVLEPNGQVTLSDGAPQRPDRPGSPLLAFLVAGACLLGVVGYSNSAQAQSAGQDQGVVKAVGDVVSFPFKILPVPVETVSKNVAVPADRSYGIKVERYTPGEVFGNGGATRCGYRTIVDGRVRFCPWPDDGDGYAESR